MVAVIVLDVVYMRINKKREAMDPEEIREKYTDEDLGQMGDRSPFFRYIL